MSFAVRLAADSFNVEPGASAAVAIEVVNDGDTRDEFELSLEGLDFEWTAIPVPTFWIEPGETHVERFFLKPPRDSASTSGSYPFVAKVRSLESGIGKSAQGTLVLEPFHHVSIDVSPRKASVSPMSRTTTTEVTVMNLGNVEQGLQLFASDVDDALTYEFEENSVTVGPGQQKTVRMKATASKVPFMSATRLAATTVSARNVQHPAVSGSGQVVFELRPLIAPGPFLVLLTVVALAVGWVMSIPKPPAVDSLSVSAREVMLGDEVTVQWQASNARSVTVDVGGTVTQMLPAIGQLTFTAKVPGDMSVRAQAVSGNAHSKEQSVVITVTKPPEVPKPEIKSFYAADKRIPIGSTATLNYKLGDSVVYAYLEPIGQLDTKANSIQVPSPPDDISGVGQKEVTYTLRAENASKQTVTKSVTVRFYKESQAKIASFSASPGEVPELDGRTTVKWSVSNAARVELKYEDKTEEVVASDEREFVVSKDTTFKLTAYDNQGLATERSVTVKVKKPAPPTVTPETTGGATGDPPVATGGTTGGTTKPVVNPDPPRAARNLRKPVGTRPR